MLRIALRVRLRASPFAQDDTRGWARRTETVHTDPEPPLCKGRWHFRKKMTVGAFVPNNKK